MDLGQGGDMGCKILEVWENTVARIQTQRSWEHGGGGGRDCRSEEWEIKKGYVAGMHMCSFDPCVSDSVTLSVRVLLALWLTSVSLTSRLWLSLPCGNPHSVGPWMLFLGLLGSSQGEGWRLSSRASVQVRKTACLGAAWRQGDFRTSLRTWRINQSSPRLVSVAPTILNGSQSPWPSICLHVS